MFDRIRKHPKYEPMLGDVEEEYRRRVVTQPIRARLWRWYQVMGLVVVYRPSRLAPESSGGNSRLRRSLETAWQDIRFGVRMLFRDRIVTVTVIATLSIGIGATSTMFSIVHGLLSDLPFPDADALMAIVIRDVATGIDDHPVPGADIRAWRETQSTMVDIAAFRREAFQVSATATRPMRYQGASISPWAFGLLGADPALGRDLTVADLESAEPPVIISHRVWQDMFDLDPGVIGASLRVDDMVRTIVGVMPEKFAFPREEHLWIPLRLDESMATSEFDVFGRLAAHADLEMAQAEFATLGQRAFSASTPVREGLSAEVMAYKYRAVGSDAPALMYTLLAFVSVVLLIACVNVTNVLLARGAVRRREVAVRAALGGSRGRLVRQFLTETMVLSLLGGLGGVVFAYFATQWFATTLMNRITIFWVSLSIDTTVLLFTVALTVLATLLSGLAPALSASRVDVAGGIKDASGGVSARRMGRMSGTLVGAEIALSCVLLVASGLMVKGVIGLSNRDLEFDTAGAMTGRVQLGSFDYPDDQAILSFYATLQERWAERGLGGMAITSRLPGRQGARFRFGIEGTPYAQMQDMPTAVLRQVTPQLFPMLQLSAVSGRLLDGRDDADALPVVLVNVAFEERHFPGGAVGQRIRLGGLDATTPWRQVVGVVDDHGVTLDDSRAFPGMFLPLEQMPARLLELMVYEGDQTGTGVAVPALLSVISAVDPNLPLYGVSSLDDVLADEILPQLTFGRLFAGFGLAALLLASVGLYGTMAFAVSNRAREIGLRRALGATVPRVVGYTLRTAAWQLTIGLAVGLTLAMLVAPAVGFFTFGTNPRDAMVFSLVPLTLAVTALLAAWVPSRRAARIEPMQVLRCD